MRALLLAALLLAPIALAQDASPFRAQWDQAAGDARHSREIVMPDYPLDVVASGVVFEPGEYITRNTPRTTPFALATLEGVFAYARTSSAATSTPTAAEIESCTLVRIRSFDPLDFERSAPAPCRRGFTLLGVHEDRGQLYDCRRDTAQAMTVNALDLATLDVRWTVRLPANLTRPPDPGASIYLDWDCSAVIEPDRIVLALSSFVENMVMAVDLDGNEIWSTPVPASVFATPFLGSSLSGAYPGQNGFRIEQIFASEGGYFVQGFAAAGTSGISWMDRDGVLLAGYYQNGDPISDWSELDAEGSARNTAPVHGMAQAETAMFVLGPQYVMARVSDLRPLTSPVEGATAAGYLIWWRDYLAFHSGDGITVVRTPGFSDPWSLNPPQPTMLDLVVTDRGELLILSKFSQADRTVEAVLSWLDLERRVETRRLDLTMFLDRGAVTSDVSAHLLPLNSEQLLVFTGSGEFAVLGRADPELTPRVEVDDEYPAVGDATSLRVAAPRGANRTLLGWEDGTFESLESEVVSHTYATGGDRIVRVTAVYPDNRTATSEVVLHVGGTPPVQLTAVQRAFSPENQELTFFLLGLAFTGGGVLFAALLRRQRHSRLAEEEAKLRKVIDASLLNPTTGLAALEAHRQHLKEQHTRRRLDDAQYGLLDHRTVRAMKSARYRLLGSALNKLSPHFRRLLDTALEDGQVTTGEMAALVSALDEEVALSAAEREKMRTLLAGWAR